MHPCGFLPAARLVQVSELADMVDFEVYRAVADLAMPGHEPQDQLVAPGAGHDWPLVGEDCCALPGERDPAEAGYQWLPSPVALDGDLQALAPPGGGVDGSPVFA